MDTELLSGMKTQLTIHEGKRHKPYRCSAGKLTIGVGRNLDDRGLSDEEIEYLLENDIKAVHRALLTKYPEFTQLSETRQKVLLDMAFNLGINGLFKFKRMFAALKANDFEKAAAEMLDSRWASQVGMRSKTLVSMMRNG
ncbi:glycoside hydrolase family protein [Pseudoalteromonas sp. T1lg65]|uniref:glycoside hydrolase family protein n=1 Tax=Pseudoalteromonas sp. T1lg65 TaxID=2077101 RepID=UPI003F7B1A12